MRRKWFGKPVMIWEKKKKNSEDKRQEEQRGEE